MFLLLAWPAAASEVELHGFAQTHYTSRITGLNDSATQGGEWLDAEVRLQLELSSWSPSGQASFSAKTDLVEDVISGEAELDLREANVALHRERFDLRLGRQIVTWGIGDLLFINDRFPKDWGAFFSGRPMEYLKLGTDGVRLTHYGDEVSLDVVVSQSFRADVLPSTDRFILPQPWPPNAVVTTTKPKGHDGTELALRAYGNFSGTDAALYAYRGFYRATSFRIDTTVSPPQVTLFYPRLNAYGFSAQGNLWGGVTGIEAGFYDSRSDGGGSDPTVPNSQTLVLISHYRQLGTNSHFGAQFYAEYMHNHANYRASLPAGFPAQPRMRQMLTLRLTQLRRHDTERLSLFAFYSPQQHDLMVIPEYHRSVTDELSVSAGLNGFGGRAGTFFGNLDGNDNAYLTARYAF